jgi:methenyltetrahydromethanopterin cyclohydrolase
VKLRKEKKEILDQKVFIVQVDDEKIYNMIRQTTTQMQDLSETSKDTRSIWTSIFKIKELGYDMKSLNELIGIIDKGKQDELV